MPTIQKLEQNLAQSQQWGAAFRSQIKKLMEEISTKNQIIAVTCRENIEIAGEIRKGEGELKGLLEERQRSGYKRDKLTIKLNELQARIAVYQEGLAKKTDWNTQLKNKLNMVEKACLEQQNITAIQQIFDGVSESKVSVSSLNSHSSEARSHKSSSKSSVHPMIDSNLSRLKKLQERYLQLTGKCRHKEEELQRQRKREAKLKEALKRLAEGEGDNKENQHREANPIQEISKQTRSQLKRVKELQEKENALKGQLQEQRAWVSKYVKHLESLTKCDAQAETIRAEMASFDRESRKEGKSVETICSYILKETQL